MAYRFKTLVEQCLSLDVKEVKGLNNGIFEFKNSLLELHLAKKGDILYTTTDQTIYLLHQRVGFGERLMFECPCCHELRRKLYIKPDSYMFACQKCHGLVYRTSRLSGNELEYIDNRIMQIQRQFDMTNAYDYGGVGFSLEYVPLDKPKYMRWRKYAALTTELKKLIERRGQIWMSKLKL